MIHILLIAMLASPTGWPRIAACENNVSACPCCPAESCADCLCSMDEDPAPKPDESRVDPPRQIVAVLPAVVRVGFDRDESTARGTVHSRVVRASGVRLQAVHCQWLT
jgi:hypothetical protein